MSEVQDEYRLTKFSLRRREFCSIILRAGLVGSGQAFYVVERTRTIEDLQFWTGGPSLLDHIGDPVKREPLVGFAAKQKDIVSRVEAIGVDVRVPQKGHR